MEMGAALAPPPFCIHVINNYMFITVTVIPKAKQKKIVKISENSFKVWVTAAPEKGKANQAVLEQLAKHFKIKKNNLRQVAGLTSREKVFERTTE